MPVVLLLRNPDQETLQKPHLMKKMPHKIRSFLLGSDPVTFSSPEWTHLKVIALLYKCIHNTKDLFYIESDTTEWLSTAQEQDTGTHPVVSEL